MKVTTRKRQLEPGRCPARDDRWCQGAGISEPDGLGNWRLTRRCLWCHGWMCLGLSDDRTVDVQIEIRAAEIATIISETPQIRWSQIPADGAEIAGWIVGRYDSSKPIADDDYAGRAGYLAYVIFEDGP